MLRLCAGSLALLAVFASPALSQKLSDPASLNEKAPATYKAKFETSKGTFVLEVRRAWAPVGADRFYNLVKNGFYDDVRFFRVVPDFVVQFGINGNPQIQSAWRDARINDDPNKQSNTAGTITFATSGTNSRTSQVFINFGDNSSLDSRGFSPFGKVSSGMAVVTKINAEYEQKADQSRIQMEGNAYLTKTFPRMDFVKKATIEK